MIFLNFSCNLYEIQSCSLLFLPFLDSVPLRPIILHLVIIILKLPKHQFLKNFLKSDHPSRLQTVLPHHHRKIHVLLLQLVNSVQQSQILIQFLYRNYHTRGLETFIWGELENQQIFQFYISHDIGPKPGIDGHLRIVVFLQIGQELPINCGLLIDHEDIIEGDHIILDFFQPEIHSILQDLNLLRPVPVLPIIVQAENRPQILRREHDLIVVVAQPVVEHVGDRPHEDVEDELQEANEGRAVVPDRHLVLPRRVGLRNHLPEDHHRHRRDYDRQVAGDDLVEEDRQRLQRERVREQQRRKQQVVVVENVQNRPRHPPLVLAIRIDPDLHLRLADRHVPHRQTRTHPREAAQQE